MQTTPINGSGHPITRILLAAGYGLLLLGSAVGNSAAQSEPLAPAVFYQELGGKDGVAAISAEFVTLMLADQRVASTFEGVDLDRLRLRLAQQLCQVSGGQCAYAGRSMAESHEDMKITNTQFNASVEHLRLAMDHHNVPSRVQNRLLARLAVMQRDIVTK